MAAILVVGAGVPGAVLHGGRSRDAAMGWPEAALGLAMAAGLLTGYIQGGGAR